MRRGLLAVGVGLALADSSIVTLALPEILGQFDVAITSVSWVLTSFNLVLAVVAVPAAYVSRRRPRESYVAGILVFGTASLACGLAPSFDVLVGARCIQAIGAALLVTSALDLLSQRDGDERALRVWVVAGVFGAALGPAAGGVLTSSWAGSRSSSRRCPSRSSCSSRCGVSRLDRVATPAGRPAVAANAALLFVAGGLVAALFLVVLLLVDGWGMSPAAAGLVVTVMPLTAIAVGRLRPRSLGEMQGVAAGVILLSGGLTALALMPRAGWGWTLPPQLLVGAGLGLTVGGLTELALRGRPDQVVHGGWTLSARHAGVVIGLLLLAPVLTSALDENRDEAIRAGAAVVLDSEIPPLDKLGVAQDVLAEVDRSNDAGELPDVERALADRPDDDEWRSLIGALQDQLTRAVTSAFSGPFLLAAVLTLARSSRSRSFAGGPREALRPAPRRARARRRRGRPLRRARRRLLRADAGRRSLPGACAAGGRGTGETIERIALTAVDNVACQLGVSREELVLALRSEDAFDSFTAENDIDRAEAERAIHDGLVGAVDEAEAGRNASRPRCAARAQGGGEPCRRGSSSRRSSVSGASFPASRGREGRRARACGSRTRPRRPGRTTRRARGRRGAGSAST